MTGYAQVRSTAGENCAFTLALKSVNHRYLDLHFRLPGGSEQLEIKLRRRLKERLARGHVDVLLTLEAAPGSVAINRELLAGYVSAFRAAAKEFALAGEPDLNAALRLPGALSPAAEANGNLEAAVLNAADAAVGALNAMREHEGAALVRELRSCSQRLEQGAEKVQQLRERIVQAQLQRLRARLQELLGASASEDRILQEAALLAERSDVQEELARLQAHCRHFNRLLEGEGEAGKKLDFLLQEMNREANTLLAKTAGLSGDGLEVTEVGLAMKAEIEKAREQAQNLE